MASLLRVAAGRGMPRMTSSFRAAVATRTLASSAEAESDTMTYAIGGGIIGLAGLVGLTIPRSGVEEHSTAPMTANAAAKSSDSDKPGSYADKSPMEANVLAVGDVFDVKHGGDASAAAAGLAEMFGVAVPDVIDEAALAKIASIKKSHPNNLAVKNFDESYYRSLSSDQRAALVQICRSGIENEDSGMGCYAMQPADYDRFKPFFSKVLSQYHKVPEDAKHVTNWNLDGVKGLPDDGKLDLSKLGLPPLSMRVRVGRNLADFPLPGAMTKNDRIAMEKKMCEAFDKLKAMPEYGGGYNSLTPGHPDFINDDQYKALVKAHIMFKDMAADTYLATAGIASDWPYGRGCYVSGDKKFVVWVGEEDHLRIMCMFKGTVLNEVFDRLHNALDVIDGIPGLSFAKSPDYGYVTSCPTNLGTGMRASVHIQLPNLTADGTDRKAKAICKPLGLSVRGTGGEHTPIGKDGTCDISPSARFCISEAEIITALYNGLKLLKAKEEEAGPQQ